MHRNVTKSVENPKKYAKTLQNGMKWR